MTRTKISIGIPVFNEERNIAALLSSLLKQTTRYECEIIVVSGGSSDRTDEIVRSFSNVKLVSEPNRRGKISAVKIILEKAVGNILIMTDGDVLLDDHAVDHVISAFECRDVRALTGQVIPKQGQSRLFHQLSLIGCQAWHDYRKRQLVAEQFVYPTGYLYALSRDLYKHIELEDSIIADDAVMGYKIKKQFGVNFYYCELAKVYVLFPQNIKDFISQKVRTRVGRRQGLYKKAFLKMEQQWRKSLLKVRENLFHIFIYYMLDLLCRILATIKDTEKFIVWSPIPSTKNISTGNLLKSEHFDRAGTDAESENKVLESVH